MFRRNHPLKSDQPTALVVFGATGDLTQNKLYPALYELAKKNALPKIFSLYGIAREKMTATQFINDIEKDLRRHYGEDLNKTALNRLLKTVQYIPADLNKREGYNKLEEYIELDERRHKRSILRLFYLALPPKLFSQVVENVNACRMGKDMCSASHTGSRVILEKPFGYDLAGAKKLDKGISKVFLERQVYRIDHYLGKEAFQNILAFRFGNTLFEHIWSNKYIDRIEINALETFGLEGRFAYYDGAGAIRDMVQNHLMQFVAYLTMQKPKSISATDLRKVKASVMKKIRPFGGKVSMIRGQYRGYKKELGIPRTSKTETYVALTLEVNTPRWKGVPIYIRTGKKLDRKETSAHVVLKDCACDIFAQSHRNTISVQISPEPSVHLGINVQKPGFVLGTKEADMHYCRSENGGPEAIGDYERLLLDVMNGDQTLFTSSTEVLESWRAVGPFLRSAKKTKPFLYAATSSGPKQSRTFIRQKDDWSPPLINCS